MGLAGFRNGKLALARARFPLTRPSGTPFPKGGRGGGEGEREGVVEHGRNLDDALTLIEFLRFDRWAGRSGNFHDRGGRGPAIRVDQRTAHATDDGKKGVHGHALASTTTVS